MQKIQSNIRRMTRESRKSHQRSMHTHRHSLAIMVTSRWLEYLPCSKPSSMVSTLTETNDCSDGSNEVENDLFDIRGTAISGISSQIYNEFIHCTQITAALQDAGQGLVTVVVTGGFSTMAKKNTTATQKQSLCSNDRPHDRFCQRLQVPNCPRSLQCKQVYLADFSAIPRCRQNGRYNVQSIVSPSSHPNHHAEISTV